MTLNMQRDWMALGQIG